MWTRDVNTAFRLVREIEAGVIWVNCFDEGDMTQPFGGYKQSGQARDKCFDSVLELHADEIGLAAAVARVTPP